MKVYDVINNETGYHEQFYSLTSAKSAMRANNAEGFITKIYSTGEWIPCGEIKLKSSNKTFIANTNQKKSNY